MASEKRVSGTSGNKKITIGRKMGHPFVKEEKETDMSCEVLHEETSNKKPNTDSVFLPSTPKMPTTTSSSIYNFIKQSERFSVGRKFFEPNSMSPEVKQEKSTGKDATTVLCKSTSSEEDVDNVVTDAKRKSSDKKTTSDFKVGMARATDATFNVPLAVVESRKKVQLEQRTSQTWELPNFTANLRHYLDNESKYADENEAVPVRTSLIQTGDQIDLQSTFLANLYLSRWDSSSDVNQNQEGKVNLNLTKGPVRASVSFEGNPVENSHEDIFVMVTLKMVDHSDEHPPMYLHYQVNLQSSNSLQIVSFVHFLTHIKVGGMSSVAEQISMKRIFSKMAPEDALIVNVNCSVYRPLIEWGLQSSEAKELIRLMLDGKVERENRRLVYSLIEKCNKFNLKGIQECLESLIPHKFFED